jgi:hypothetical protein
MIKIVGATNLLGDSIYAINAIKGWLTLQSKDQNVILVADRGLPYQLYKLTFGHLIIFDSIEDAVKHVGIAEFEIIKLSAGDAGKICFDQAQLTGKQPHITEGFAQLLGYKYEGDLRPYAPWLDNMTWPKAHYIGIAPFSRSCARHSKNADGSPGTPNKTLDDWKWNNIVSYLRQQDLPLTILCGPKDRQEKVSVSEDEYYTAPNIENLCTALKSCKVFITVDNGLGHLASLLDVPTIILWPVVSSIGFIAPLWAPKTRYIQLEPNSATPAAIFSGLRPYVEALINEEKSAQS